MSTTLDLLISVFMLLSGAIVAIWPDPLTRLLVWWQSIGISQSNEKAEPSRWYTQFVQAIAIIWGAIGAVKLALIYS